MVMPYKKRFPKTCGFVFNFMSTIFVLFSAFNKHINNLREKQDIFKNIVIYLQDLKIVRIILAHIVCFV